MNEIELASWDDRFWAWLIDVLLMSILWHRVMISQGMDVFSLSGTMLLASLLFIYWTALEGYRGQSLGKMVLNIVVSGSAGESIRYRDAALEAFGKAFLLPIDFLIGWLYLREKRQRLFSRLSDTIVIHRRE